MEALIVWELKHQDLVETRQGQVKEIENPDLVFFSTVYHCQCYWTDPS